MSDRDDIDADLAALERDIERLESAESVSPEAAVRGAQTLAIARRQRDELRALLDGVLAGPRLLGIPVIRDAAMPAGSAELRDANGDVLGRIDNLGADV